MGLLLLVAHGFAALQPVYIQQWLKQLPRSRFWGMAILGVDAVWGWLLVYFLDMGEFSAFQRPVLVLIPIAYYLCIRYVEEFLAVRALGIFCLLAAEPLLCAAFLKPPTSRLLLVVLAYAWIVIGMVWIAIPYVLRDQIQWLQKSVLRWWSAVVGGLVYGMLILVAALLWY